MLQSCDNPDEYLVGGIIYPEFTFSPPENAHAKVTINQNIKVDSNGRPYAIEGVATATKITTKWHALARCVKINVATNAIDSSKNLPQAAQIGKSEMTPLGFPFLKKIVTTRKTFAPDEYLSMYAAWGDAIKMKGPRLKTAVVVNKVNDNHASTASKTALPAPKLSKDFKIDCVTIDGQASNAKKVVMSCPHDRILTSGGISNYQKKDTSLSGSDQVGFMFDEILMSYAFTDSRNVLTTNSNSKGVAVHIRCCKIVSISNVDKPSPYILKSQFKNGKCHETQIATSGGGLISSDNELYFGPSSSDLKTWSLGSNAKGNLFTICTSTQFSKMLQLSSKIVKKPSTESSTTHIDCPDNWVMLGGGSLVQNNNDKSHTYASSPTNNGWIAGTWQSSDMSKGTDPNDLFAICGQLIEHEESNTTPQLQARRLGMYAH